MAQIDAVEFALAMKTLKGAKNFFLLLVVLALVVQAAGFVMIYFLPDAVNAKEILAQVNNPTYQPTDVNANAMYKVLIWCFPVTKLMALFCAAMLVIILMFSTALSLLGGGKGVYGLVSGFFWSLILLALVSPWQEILKGALFTGALYNLDELAAWASQLGNSATRWTQMMFFARFLGYPAITLAVLALVQAKFAGGYNRATTTTSSQPQQPVM